jgi:hypothetical protein
MGNVKRSLWWKAAAHLYWLRITSLCACQAALTRCGQGLAVALGVKRARSMSKSSYIHGLHSCKSSYIHGLHSCGNSRNQNERELAVFVWPALTHFHNINIGFRFPANSIALFFRMAETFSLHVNHISHCWRASRLFARLSCYVCAVQVTRWCWPGNWSSWVIVLFKMGAGESRAGEMAQQLKAFVTFAKDPVWPPAPTYWFTTTHNSSSREPTALL